MNKLTLIFLLAMSTSAYSNWISIGTTPTGRECFVDSFRINRVGVLVQGWTLESFKSINVVEDIHFLSSAQLREFDCANDKTRLLKLIEYSESMGKGDIVFSGDLTESETWTAALPNSVLAGYMKYFCKK